MSTALATPTNDFDELLHLNDAEIESRLESYGDDQEAFDRLHGFLDLSIRRTVQAIHVGAMAWKRMKKLAADRGFTLEVNASTRTLDLIADGRTDAQVLFQLFSQPIREALAAKVLQMPLDVQRSLVVDRKPIPIAERGGSDHRQVDIFSLPIQVENLVLTRSGIRSLGEQKIILANDSTKSSRPAERADLESLTVSISEKSKQILASESKRERKRLAWEMRELAEKIELLVR